MEYTFPELFSNCPWVRDFSIGCDPIWGISRDLQSLFKELFSGSHIPLQHIDTMIEDEDALEALLRELESLDE